MTLHIDISKNIHQQFKDRIGGKDFPNGFTIHPSIGTNEAAAVQVRFPGNLELYHFGTTQFRIPLEMDTTNPPDSPWLFIHINLSRFGQEKRIGGDTIFFQRSLPIGILFCGPGLEMHTVLPAGTESEVLSIRFYRYFVATFLPGIEASVDLDRPIAYEDLDDELGESLTQVLASLDNKLSCHAHLLTFLNELFGKLSRHQKPGSVDSLHPDDLRQIMRIATNLRDPLEPKVPALPDLAQRAGMGVTKFKDSFKLVFGQAPLQYRNRIRMAYAREELLHKRKTASELSYELGYSHPSNFTAAFKRHFGKLPSAV
ncbi:AraC-like DNA-binding protein [Neolewinella xylanilytica]|uniref:AraC-like DNA-binding protein n=1 Tax=Neolewinella xylanilytica TaxID=1514080 RepID=A0A2S6I8P9_9BACT|nr:AraC family transcriptional regulator [Neolewinella xylanilytica]PPK87874.1 AraC-like DNA-binding protein [Neolewinella xylanilytica]